MQFTFTQNLSTKRRARKKKGPERWRRRREGKIRMSVGVSDCAGVRGKVEGMVEWKWEKKAERECE